MSACRAIYANELLNEAQRHVLAYESAFKLTAFATQQLQKSFERVSAEIAALKAKTRGPTSSSAMLGQEIWQALRAMNAKERTAAIAKANHEPIVARAKEHRGRRRTPRWRQRRAAWAGIDRRIGRLPRGSIYCCLVFSKAQ